MKSNYKRIGDYIRVVDERNTDLRVENLLGLSITKEFVPSVANTVGTDMSKYKIVKKNQFVCSTMQVRRDKKMPVALLQHTDEGIISPAYYVFEVIDENILLPEYLMMWFSRSEFDREACFYAIGGVRGSLEWEDFCDMKIPIHSIEKQREIVKEYNTILNRIKLNENIIEKLENLSQVLYQQWFVEFKYNNETLENKPMKYIEELNREIPMEWQVCKLGELIDVVNGFAFKSDELNNEVGIPVIKISNIKSSYIDLKDTQKVSYNTTKSMEKYMVKKGDVLISMTGSHMTQINSAVGKVGRYFQDTMALINQRVCNIKVKEQFKFKEYIYLFMKQKETQQELLNGATGSANQANISAELINELKIIKPSNDVLEKFEFLVNNLYKQIYIKKEENIRLNVLKDILLAKLSRG